MQRNRITGSESGSQATNTVHAQVAGHRATARTGDTGDVTRHIRGYWHQAGAQTEGPQLRIRARDSTPDVMETQTVDARLWDDVRQREGAERELWNLISQVQGHKQEGEETDDTRQREDKVNNFSDPKYEKPDKGQLQVRQDKSNVQNSAARQTAQKRAANSAEETAEIDSSRYHSGSDRDSNRVRSDAMPDSGEATPTVLQCVMQCVLLCVLQCVLQCMLQCVQPSMFPQTSEEAKKG